MEKRYQVFVSSTFKDLVKERQEIIEALLELDCIPSGMELFPAADEDQWTLIKRVIDDCDYYVVVIAGRYGSIGSTGTSYTQMEYEYASSIGKPIIAFLHGEPGSLPVNRTESAPEAQQALLEFRALAERRLCKYWTSPKELGSVVSRSLVKLMKYKQANPLGYAYSWYCELYRDWKRHLDVVMRQEHRAGEKTFVDYAG